MVYEDAKQAAKKTGDIVYIRPKMDMRQGGYTCDVHYSEDAVCRIYPGGRVQPLTIDFSDELTKALIEEHK